MDHIYVVYLVACCQCVRLIQLMPQYVQNKDGKSIHCIALHWNWFKIHSFIFFFYTFKKWKAGTSSLKKSLWNCARKWSIWLVSNSIRLFLEFYMEMTEIIHQKAHINGCNYLVCSYTFECNRVHSEFNRIAPFIWKFSFFHAVRLVSDRQGAQNVKRWCAIYFCQFLKRCNIALNLHLLFIQPAYKLGKVVCMSFPEPVQNWL